MLYITVILDLRYKLAFVDFLLKEVYGVEIGSRLMLQVKDVLTNMFVDCKRKLQPENDNFEERLLVQATKQVDDTSIEN